MIPAKGRPVMLLPLATFFLAVLFWCVSSGFSGSLAMEADFATLRLDNSPLTMEEVRRLRESEGRLPEPSAFTAWRQIDSRPLQSKGLGRQANADVLLICGASNLLLPTSPMIGANDRTGCLIDRETSYALFGDENAVGGIVTYAGKDYTVRGVFSAPKGTFLIQSQGMGDESFNRLSLSPPAKSPPKAAAEEFSIRHGLSQELIHNSTTYAAWGNFFGRLPAFLALMLLFCLGVGRALHLRKRPVAFLLLLLFTFGSAALLLWVGGFELKTPQSLIPTRWSDFEFWGRLAASWKEAFIDFLWMKKERPDVFYLEKLFYCGAASLLGAVAFAYYWKRRPSGLMGFYCSAAMAAAAGFLGTLTASRLGYPGGQQTALFFFPIFLLLLLLLDELTGWLTRLLQVGPELSDAQPEAPFPSALSE